MSDTRLKEPFLAALGVLESLTDAWHSLPTDVTADTSLRDLIAKEGLSLFSKQASLLTSFDSLHRLFNVCGRLKVLGGPYFIQPTKLTFVLRKMIIQKMEEWDATKKTQIQRLDSLAQWAALTVSVEARSSKESVIVALWVGQTFAIEVSPLQADLAASRDSLRIVEIGVKLMRLLPEVHQQRVSKIPDEHIKALQASEVGSPEVIAGGHDNFTGKTVVGAREHSAFNKLEEVRRVASV